MQPVIGLGILLAVLAGCETPDASSELAKASQPGEEDTLALAQRAGAPLFEGMSDYHMPITTQHDNAQRYFNQGMVLAFAFNHAESIRSFRAAQTLDPSCAMCFWGEALATGPNINVTSKGKVIMSAAERVAAFAALAEAVALKPNASAREQAYIDALAQRYNGDPETPRGPLDLAWAQAMGELAAQYPEDMTAAAIYAEALMNTMPWNYWSDDGIAKPETSAVIESFLQGDFSTAAGHFKQAVAAQHQLPYTEPPFWYYPTRQSLGAALLAGCQPEQAETVFRRDLELYPHNGWSMFGLAQSLDAQGKNGEAAKVRHHFESASQFADVALTGAIL